MQQRAVMTCSMTNLNYDYAGMQAAHAGGARAGVAAGVRVPDNGRPVPLAARESDLNKRIQRITRWSRSQTEKAVGFPTSSVAGIRKSGRAFGLDVAVARLTSAERAERGKAARSALPREGHAVFDPPADRADPVGLLERQAASRLPDLCQSGTAGC